MAVKNFHDLVWSYTLLEDESEVCLCDLGDVDRTTLTVTGKKVDAGSRLMYLSSVEHLGTSYSMPIYGRNVAEGKELAWMRLLELTGILPRPPSSMLVLSIDGIDIERVCARVTLKFEE